MSDTLTVDRPKESNQSRPKQQPPYHVILHDDNEHTFDYVIRMLVELFRHTSDVATRLTKEVDRNKVAIVDTTTLERAELKRDQIHAYGKDTHIKNCKGSMKATIEPAE